MMLVVKVKWSFCWYLLRCRDSLLLGILKGYSAPRVVSTCTDIGWHQQGLSLKL